MIRIAAQIEPGLFLNERVARIETESGPVTLFVWDRDCAEDSVAVELLGQDAEWLLAYTHGPTGRYLVKVPVASAIRT